MDAPLGRQFYSDKPHSGLDVVTEHGRARVLRLRTDQAYLYDVEIDEGFRGQGLGTDLMRKVCREADGRGDVLTASAHEGHHEWYKRFGFELQPKETFLGLPVLKRQPDGR